MHNGNRLMLIACSALILACTQAEPTAPTALENTLDGPSWGHPYAVSVMTQNMYVGADVDAIIGALLTPDPNDDVTALLQQIQILQETDFPTRANALADAIAARRPHIVGLQEVSTLDMDLTALGIPFTYDMDFLTVLNQALEARGLRYRVAGKVQNFVAAPIPGISLTDYDVVLVDKARVRVGRHVVARVYSNNLGPVTPGVELSRGFVSFAARIGGRWYRVASTHLESDLGGQNLSPLRAAQMQELVQLLGQGSPAIIMGDLNDFAGSPMHQAALDAGFTDTWAALEPADPGFTCCHASDLTDARIPNQRIDYIFARGIGHRHSPLVGKIARIGLLPEEMVSGPVHPIYASDHAGLAARRRTKHEWRDWSDWR
jgi:endonuclease/exonuclease/phosphatase family metal-dependent hydrolase